MARGISRRDAETRRFFSTQMMGKCGVRSSELGGEMGISNIQQGMSNVQGECAAGKF